MKLYIAGQVTGIKNLNRPRFYAVASSLQRLGYETVVPHDHVPAAATWHEAMEICLPLLLECDGLALIDGWQHSEGAMLEVKLARNLLIDTRGVKEWIARSEFMIEER